MSNKINSPLACLTLLKAKSMRFRWNEDNTNRNHFFSTILSSTKDLLPLELIHSQTVVAVNEKGETQGLQADGVITCNPNLVPVITVADCMPLYLWDDKTGCFGVLHSGWKGTGIITQALQLAEQTYNAKASDFKVVIGPHIHDCCYSVDEQRAQYFIENFTKGCIRKKSENSYQLSLKNANMYLLECAGVKKENIHVVDMCTCCTTGEDGAYVFGSFRRETATLKENTPLKEMQKHFTPMAAFMCYENKQDIFSKQTQITNDYLSILTI